MRTIKTEIIPIQSTIAKVNAPRELNREAICVFVATGFFLDTDTYWKNEVVLKPGTINYLDDKNFLIESESWFQWHYSPKNIDFNHCVTQFSELFESIIDEQVGDKKVILPLSGGLDSRTQAVALKNHSQIHTYSYRFKNGYPEDYIGEKIADSLGFEFTKLEVSNGYLWDSIEQLAEINQCYSDFTHPRQMAFIEQYAKMGEVFSLGHWGDVLFDGMGSSVKWTKDQEINWVLKKIVKKGGLELAENLWKEWGLNGNFKNYFVERIKGLLESIKIENTSAKLRAFKTNYWAPRWTSVNLGVFESALPISLPYYDQGMCEFICTVPEEYLKGRKIQIEYIKRKSQKVANITWHAQKPFNLNNYNLNKSPYNLPYRILNKVKREFNNKLGRPHVSRNWELQFIGAQNDENLRGYLFSSELLNEIPKGLVNEFYEAFKSGNTVKYSHPVSMLLTLAAKFKMETLK